MAKPLRHYTTLSLVLMIGGCVAQVEEGEPAAEGVSTPADDVAAGAPAPLTLAEVPAGSVELARTLLAEAFGSGVAPNWTATSELEDAVYVYERPGVEGPAYFEFGVSDGGRILVATGRHDSPIPSFSDLGEPLALALQDEAAKRGERAAHLLRLSARDLLATNEAGEIVAQSDLYQRGVGLFLDEYLAALELASRDEGTPKSASSEPSYDEQWDALYPEQPKATTVLYQVNATLAVRDIKWLYHSDLLRTHILWEQHDLDTSRNVCWAGCGPVAFAQVAAYLAYSDRWGNPKYQGSGSRNLYPNVSTRSTAPEARSLIEELHYQFDSFCWTKVKLGDSPVFNESAAAPWSVGSFKDWAATKNANVNLVTSWGGPSGGDETGAWNAIRRGNPVVLGWNFEHYNIGVGAGYLNNTKYVWINNGQANTRYDGWMPYETNSLFFSGIINSWVAGQ